MNAWTTAPPARPGIIFAVLLGFQQVAWPALVPPPPQSNSLPATTAQRLPLAEGAPAAALERSDPPAGHRPRTLAAARAQLSAHGRYPAPAPGAGATAGWPRAFLSLAAESMESYDARLIALVQRRWHQLRTGTRLVLQPGKVILDFNLASDGSVADMSVTSSEGGALLSALCLAAVLDTAPYTPWPPALRREIGDNQRPVTLTFEFVNSDPGVGSFQWHTRQGHLFAELCSRPAAPNPVTAVKAPEPSPTGFPVGGPLYWPAWCAQDWLPCETQTRHVEQQWVKEFCDSLPPSWERPSFCPPPMPPPTPPTPPLVKP